MAIERGQYNILLLFTTGIFRNKLHQENEKDIEVRVESQE